jgi:twitching motility protein PilI
MPLALQSPPSPLLAPTEALLRGFVFDEPEQAAVAAPAAHAVASSAAGVMLREGFRIGDLRLMIRYEDGSELTDLPPLYRLPRAPAWFLGMANLHGALVPVFDPAVLFGVAHDEAAKTMLLVLGHGEARAGIVIDGLPQRLRLASGDRIDQVCLPPRLAACAGDAFWSGEADLIDVQVDALLEQVNEELAGAP